MSETDKALIGKIYWQRILSGDGTLNDVETTRGKLSNIKLSDTHVMFTAVYEHGSDKLRYSLKLERENVAIPFKGTIDAYDNNGNNFKVEVEFDLYTTYNYLKYVLHGKWHDADATYEFYCHIVELPA